MQQSKLPFFLPAIQSIDSTKPLTKQDLLTESLLIDQEKDLAMYYSPHNEYINHRAKLVIIGITPGWSQMRMAIEQLKHSLHFQKHLPLEQMLKQTKMAASFAGTMRQNLIEMLDQCGLPTYFHLKSSVSLFEEHRDFIHTTSLIKYPVFHKNNNYTGHQPKVEQSSLLSTYAYDVFPAELNQIKDTLLLFL